MVFRAIKDKVIIKLDDEIETTEGGLHLSRGYHETPERGEVVSVGGSVKTVKVGDRVQSVKMAGYVIFDDKKQKYISCTESEIAAII